MSYILSPFFRLYCCCYLFVFTSKTSSSAELLKCPHVESCSSCWPSQCTGMPSLGGAQLKLGHGWETDSWHCPEYSKSESSLERNPQNFLMGQTPCVRLWRDSQNATQETDPEPLGARRWVSLELGSLMSLKGLEQNNVSGLSWRPLDNTVLLLDLIASLTFSFKLSTFLFIFSARMWYCSLYSVTFSDVKWDRWLFKESRVFFLGLLMSPWQIWLAPGGAHSMWTLLAADSLPKESFAWRISFPKLAHFYQAAMRSW